jgi:hypothetical protein
MHSSAQRDRPQMPMSGRGAFACLCTCLNLDGDQFDFAVRNRRTEHLRAAITIAQLSDGRSEYPVRHR